MSMFIIPGHPLLMVGCTNSTQALAQRFDWSHPILSSPAGDTLVSVKCNHGLHHTDGRSCNSQICAQVKRNAVHSVHCTWHILHSDSVSLCREFVSHYSSLGLMQYTIIQISVHWHNLIWWTLFYSEHNFYLQGCINIIFTRWTPCNPYLYVYLYL